MTFFLQQTINGIALGGVFGLVAVGFSLVLANLKMFHVAHEGIFAWGAVFAWLILDWIDVPFLVVVTFAMLAAGLLNVLAYMVLLRHLQSRSNSELAGFISSMGGLIVLTAAAEQVLDQRTLRLPFDLFPVHTWRLAGLQVSSIQVVMILAALAALLLLSWLVNRTALGRELRTIAYDRELGSLLGINVDRVTQVVFFVSGAFAGLSGVLVAIAFNVVDAQMGQPYVVLAIAVTVVGGFGSVRGVIVAALLLGVISSYTTAYVTSSYRDVVIFTVMIAFLLWRPQGLFKVSEATMRA